MRVSLRWLSDYVDLPTQDPEAIRNALASLGHEVESIEHLGVEWTGVKVVRVDTVERHPNADKVRVCAVDDGDSVTQVVCGAWNFEAGALVAFAVPGAVLPGGFQIGNREIRGVMSAGMICSERELGLGDDHAGILVLDDDAPIGADLADYVELPDVVFDLSITPNRPDAMSMIGIARDLAAHYGVTMRIPTPSPATVPGKPDTEIRIADPTGCRRFVVREVQDIEIGPSPFWMRRRLRAAGMRPISNAVDVTNYVMLEMGHPLHAFDADRVRGASLVVRRATAGETLVTLDDVDRRLDPRDLIIADAGGPTSMSGTMGGAESEVNDRSRRILLEAATWDPPTIMWMSRRHNLRSEASARFERGVDPELPLLATARAAELLLASGGGRLLADPVDVVAVPFERPVIPLDVTEVERVLGPGFDPADVASMLGSIGLDVAAGEPLRVTIPGFRPDLERPIDLIEEIARLHGYDRFDDSVPTGAAGGWTEEQRRSRIVRSALVGAGMNQAIHLSFIGPDDLDAFGYPADHEARRVVTVKNPLRDEESKLRTTLLPGLLRTARYNRAHGIDDVALFEIGKVFFSTSDRADPRIPLQPDRLGLVITGHFGGRALGDAGRPADVFTATALWRVIEQRLSLGDVRLEAASPPGFHPGRTAAVSIGGTPVGFVGEIHPTTSAFYELEGRVAAAELDLDPLIAAVDPPLLVTPSTFPPVEFDLAFVVDRSMPVADLVRATSDAGDPYVTSAVVFDEYLGRDDGRKSLAIRYELRAGDRTLTGDEVAPIRTSMIEAAAGLGAELRGGS